MKRAVAECNLCGKTVTAEEIETGASLICQTCDPNDSKQESKPAERTNDGVHR